MEIRITLKRQVGICISIIKLILNDTDKSRTERFGYPEIETGGHFSDESISFDLPTCKKKFSEFPITQRFDGVDLGHDLAKRRAELYTSTMRTRIKVTWDNFKSIPDDFGGEEVFTI